MKTAVICLGLVLLLVIYWFYQLVIFNFELYRKIDEQKRENEQQEQRIQQLDNSLREATKAAYLRQYFISKRSPLASYSAQLVDIANEFGLDPHILPAISMAESTGCKYYITSTNNCLGWGGGRIRFESIEQSFREVAKQITQSHTYRGYQQFPSAETLSRAYNPSHWQDYEKKISYFMKEINERRIN